MQLKISETNLSYESLKKLTILSISGKQEQDSTQACRFFLSAVNLSKTDISVLAL